MQTGLTVGEPPLVPLGQSGATDAAFVGNVGEWASGVDAFAQALTALRGERNVRVGRHSFARTHDVQHLSGANVVRHACLLDPCPRCNLSRAEADALRHRHFLTAVESDPGFA